MGFVEKERAEEHERGRRVTGEERRRAAGGGEGGREVDRGTWSRSRGIRRSCATARGSSSPGTPLYRQVQSRRESAIVPTAAVAPAPRSSDQESVEIRGSRLSQRSASIRRKCCARG